MHGLVLIDKPEGLSSMDVVRRVRRVLKIRRVGHTGTLDPLATGLLPVAIGACTKLPRFLSLDPKVYTFEMVFGVATDTCDPEGVQTETGRFDVGADEIESVLPQFVGCIEQVPPRHSAVRVDGERAYERARRGEEFEVPAREVRIDALELCSLEAGVAAMKVTCGGGTYVRSLARDIARAFGTVAHARAIRRLAVGEWSIDAAVSVDQLEDAGDPWTSIARPLEMVRSLPHIELDDYQFERTKNGNRIYTVEFAGEGFVALVRGGRLISVAEVHESHDDGALLQPRRVIAS